MVELDRRQFLMRGTFISSWGRPREVLLHASACQSTDGRPDLPAAWTSTTTATARSSSSVCIN